MFLLLLFNVIIKKKIINKNTMNETTILNIINYILSVESGYIYLVL